MRQIIGFLFISFVSQAAFGYGPIKSFGPKRSKNPSQNVTTQVRSALEEIMCERGWFPRLTEFMAGKKGVNKLERLIFPLQKEVGKPLFSEEVGQALLTENARLHDQKYCDSYDKRILAELRELRARVIKELIQRDKMPLVLTPNEQHGEALSLYLAAEQLGMLHVSLLHMSRWERVDLMLENPNDEDLGLKTFDQMLAQNEVEELQVDYRSALIWKVIFNHTIDSLKIPRKLSIWKKAEALRTSAFKLKNNDASLVETMKFEIEFRLSQGELKIKELFELFSAEVDFLSNQASESDLLPRLMAKALTKRYQKLPESWSFASGSPAAKAYARFLKSAKRYALNQSDLDSDVFRQFAQIGDWIASDELPQYLKSISQRLPFVLSDSERAQRFLKVEVGYIFDMCAQAYKYKRKADYKQCVKILKMTADELMKVPNQNQAVLYDLEMWMRRISPASQVFLESYTPGDFLAQAQSDLIKKAKSRLFSQNGYFKSSEELTFQDVLSQKEIQELSKSGEFNAKGQIFRLFYPSDRIRSSLWLVTSKDLILVEEDERCLSEPVTLRQAFDLPIGMPAAADSQRALMALLDQKMIKKACLDPLRDQDETLENLVVLDQALRKASKGRARLMDQDLVLLEKKEQELTKKALLSGYKLQYKNGSSQYDLTGEKLKNNKEAKKVLLLPKEL